MADLADSSPVPPQRPAARPVLSGESLMRRHLSTFVRRPSAVLGLAVLLAAVGLAALAPLVAPQDPYDLAQLDIMDNMLPPGGSLATGIHAVLGTDDQGRDMFS